MSLWSTSKSGSDSSASRQFVWFAPRHSITPSVVAGSYTMSDRSAIMCQKQPTQWHTKIIANMSLKTRRAAWSTPICASTMSFSA
jgi:hypothetical protein